jgi:hypothetical protein
MMRTMREDLYTIVATVDPESKRATFRFHVNPFVSFIWLGLVVLIVGASVSLWPEAVFGTSRVWAFARAGAGVATGAMFAVWLAMTPASAYANTRPRPVLTVVRPESPLPRLWASGALLAPGAGLAAGLLVAGFVTRRSRKQGSSPPSS